MFQRMTVIDDKAFEAISSVLDGPFALCSLLTDPEGRPADYRFLRVNRHFEDATGLVGAEGRTALEIVPDLDRKWIERFGQVALEGRPASFRDGFTTAAGQAYEVRAAPSEPSGAFTILLRDVTELRRIEEERAALDHARNLLRELNHRVMNSFASISAIVGMETRAAPPEARPPLDRIQGRVQALASLYRRLEGAPWAERIDVADYLRGNLASFRASLAGEGVEIVADLAPVMVPTQMAVPLALVVNELLTNAVKHAFASGQPGRVEVTLVAEGGRCRLTVADDGAGPQEHREVRSGLGAALVAAFVAELGGEMSLESDARGTRATIGFPA